MHALFSQWLQEIRGEMYTTPHQAGVQTSGSGVKLQDNRWDNTAVQVVDLWAYIQSDEYAHTPAVLPFGSLNFSPQVFPV